MALHVSHEWLPFAGADAAEVAAWGSLRIELDDPRVVLTEAEDKRAQTVCRDVVGALLPLASWLARKWLLLFRSPRIRPAVTAPRAERYEWERSHCLRFVGDGTALPDLSIEGAGRDAIRLRWLADDGDPTRPLRFLISSSSLTLRWGEVEIPFAELVDGVLARLRLLAPGEPATVALDQAWARARNPGHAEHAPARLAAQAGLDWSLLADSARGAWRALAENTSGLFEQALAALPPGQAAQASGLADELARAATEAAPDTWWSGLRNRVGAPPAGLPWQVGWECAHRLRTAERIAHDAPWSPPPVSPAVTSFDIDSAVAIVEGRAPLRFATDPRKDNRFRQARDVWPVLFGDQAAGSAWGAVFSRRSDADFSVARAFSAELLAPIAGIQKRIGDGADEDDISWLAKELGGAPEACVRHQLENHRLLVAPAADLLR